MKKRVLVVFCAMLCLLLSSCMKMNMEINVDSEGKAKASMKLLVSKQMLDSYGSEDSLYDNVKDLDYKKITETIDGQEYIGYEVKNQEADGVKTKVDGDKVTLTLPMSSFSDLGMDSSQLSSSGYSLDQLKKLGMEMKAVVNMPSEPESNVGTIDGNSVTIDLLKLSVDGQKEDIVITSKLSSGSAILYIVIGVVVAIIIILLIVFMLKKKNKKSTQFEVASETTPEVVDIPEEDVKPVETPTSETKDE